MPTAGRALVILLATLLAPGAAAADRLPVEDSHWGEERDEVSPGDTGRVLTVVFRNGAAHALTRLEARLALPEGVTAAYVGGDRAQSGLLASGDAWEARFALDLDPTLAVGDVLRIPVTTTSSIVEDAVTGRLGARQSETTVVELPVTGTTRLAVGSETSTLPAGGAATAPVVVRNLGDGTATTLEVSFAPEAGSGLEVDEPTAPIRLADLAPGASATLPVRILTPGTEGLEGLVATVVYVNAAGVETEQERTLPFRVLDDPLGPFDARLTDERLAAGRTQDVTFTVTAREAVDDVVAELRVQPPVGAPPAIVPLNTSGVRSIGDLSPGVTAHVVIPVAVAETGTGTHALSLALTWRDADGIGHKRTYAFGVVVGGLVELDVDELCASLDTTTRRVSMSAHLTNLGNTPAENAAAYVPARDGLAASEVEDLGDIDPNDAFTFELETTADPERAPATLPVVLEWSMEGGRKGIHTVEVALLRDAPACFEAPSSADAGRGIPSAGSLGVLAATAVAALAALLRRR